MANIALGFVLYLNVVIEESRRRSWLRWGLSDWISFEGGTKAKIQDWPCYFLQAL